MDKFLETFEGKMENIERRLEKMEQKGLSNPTNLTQNDMIKLQD